MRVTGVTQGVVEDLHCMYRVGIAGRTEDGVPGLSTVGCAEQSSAGTGSKAEICVVKIDVGDTAPGIKGCKIHRCSRPRSGRLPVDQLALEAARAADETVVLVEKVQGF